MRNVERENLLFKALEDAKRILYAVANCEQCGHCRNLATNVLGYQIKMALQKFEADKASNRRGPRKKVAGSTSASDERNRAEHGK